MYTYLEDHLNLSNVSWRLDEDEADTIKTNALEFEMRDTDTVEKGVDDETGYIEDIVASMPVIGVATVVSKVSSSVECEAPAVLVVSVLVEAGEVVVDSTLIESETSEVAVVSASAVGRASEVAIAFIIVVVEDNCLFLVIEDSEGGS